MRRFSVGGYWSGAHFSAADQARFFASSTDSSRRARAPRARCCSSIVALAALGLLALLARRRLPDLLQGRLALHRPRAPREEAALFERGPLRRLDGRAQRQQASRLRRSHAARRRAADFPDGTRCDGEPSAACVDIQPRPHRVSASSSPTRPATTSPGGGCRATAEPGVPAPARARPRPRAAPPAPPRTRPAGARRLPAGARLAALVRWAGSGRGDLVGTYIATATATTPARRRPYARAGGSGRPLRMGTGHDDLSARAHTRNAPAAPCATA